MPPFFHYRLFLFLNEKFCGILIVCQKKTNETNVVEITFLNHTSSNNFDETLFKRIWLMLGPEIDGESFLYDPR